MNDILTPSALLPEVQQRPLPSEALAALQQRFGTQCSTAAAVREQHGRDLTATVQPGVTREQLNEALRHMGLFFPIDPGANATIGGMAATRASGTNAVRYGTMRENVLALEVVTASGEVIHTGTRAKKSSAGYDLTRLFVGSEGTLGVMTAITVRLFPLPEAVSAAVCSFPSVEGAVREQAEAVQAIADEHGGHAFAWASTPEERTRLWTARHRAYFAGVQSRPGCRAITTDACVPISRLADNVLAAVADADAAGIPYFMVGHVGDGNFHMGYLIDPNDTDERERAERLNRAIVERALASGGTCTGEHGVGLHKRDFLRAELGDGAITCMRAIKAALDPHDILNPGKIFSA